MGLELPDASSSASSSAGRPQRASIARPGREALPAVAVVRADARERVGVAVVGIAQVAELRMDEAVQELAADHPAAADPGADREVAEGVEPLGGAPAVLAERGGVDVGVERDRHAEPAARARARRRCSPSPASASS